MNIALFMVIIGNILFQTSILFKFGNFWSFISGVGGIMGGVALVLVLFDMYGDNKDD